MRLPDVRNEAARQAVHGSAPCARTEVTGRAGLEFVCVLDTTGLVGDEFRTGSSASL